MHTCTHTRTHTTNARTHMQTHTCAHTHTPQMHAHTQTHTTYHKMHMFHQVEPPVVIVHSNPIWYLEVSSIHNYIVYCVTLLIVTCQLMKGIVIPETL